MSMTKYAAFLRAINVGKRRVKMDRLREIISELAVEDVSTILASGNVVFSSETKESELESLFADHLEDSLKFEVPTFVRSVSSVQALTSPFTLREGETLFIAFLRRELTSDEKARILEFETDDDRFEVDGRELFWGRIGKSHESKFSNAALERAIKSISTIRNMNTIEKVAAC